MKNKLLAGVSKKAVAVLLSASMMVPGVMAYADDAQEDAVLYYGDVDQNGEVTADDALSILKHVVKLQSIEDELALILADMTGDGEISAEDALQALKVVVKLVEQTVYEAPTPDPIETPDPTETPAPVETPAPTATPDPTETPDPTPTPVPTIPAYMKPKEIPFVEPGTPYAGTAAEVMELNGATLSEDGIIEFTDTNAANEKGVQMTNPLAGRSDLRETVEEALAGQPDIYTSLTELQKSNFDPSATYPRPVWKKGASISFWAKADWANGIRPDAAPILVIHDSTDVLTAAGEVNQRCEKNFAFMLRLNGGMTFESGNTPKNSLRGVSYLAGENNTWNYYTVTFSNDWICVYVNGQENVFKSVVLLKDQGTKFFNDGFLTRYNTIGAPTQEDVDNDIRGYITASGGFRNGEGDKEFGIIGNGRYANPNAVSIAGGSGSPLLMDYITGDDTEIWIGGLPNTKRLSVDISPLGVARYQLNSGTQVADVMTYDKELTAEEVSANYATATRPDGTPVTPSVTPGE